jgi:tRNA G18 (ribose-2'-O)-methylase SpoU
MGVVVITDRDDPMLDPYRALKDARVRDDAGLFVAEGMLVIERLVASTYEVASILCAPARTKAIREFLGERPIPLIVASNEVMSSVAGFPLHRGAMALGRRRVLPDAVALASTAQRVLIADDVTNPDNIGGLFRIAAAFGVDAVLLSDTAADPLYRKATRVSMGWTLHVPYARWPSTRSAVHIAAEAGLVSVALTPRPDVPTLRAQTDALRGRRVALLVGAEEPGLGDDVLREATVRARIALDRRVDSLSVVTAAAVAAHEVWAGS